LVETPVTVDVDAGSTLIAFVTVLNVDPLSVITLVTIFVAREPERTAVVPTPTGVCLEVVVVDKPPAYPSPLSTAAHAVERPVVVTV
tara:strand:- start:216 stop:476 length:261 start_codon:yes stop_codon:yes gene_type:complete